MPTEKERSLVGQIAANKRWARVPDRAAATKPARAGLRAKFAREIDPGGTMAPDELERRIKNLEAAHMAKMTLAAAKARAAKPRKARKKTRRAPISETAADAD